MNRRVVITGLGVVSSIGIGWRQFWDGLIAGRSGISPVSSFDTRDYFTHNGGEVKQFRPAEHLGQGQATAMDRCTQMAAVAAQQAIDDAGLAAASLGTMRAGVSFGTTTGSIQTIERINDLLVASQQVPQDLYAHLPPHTTPSGIGKRHGLTGPVMMFSTACAAGNYAIGYGADMLDLGRADVMIVGAADPFARISFTGFNQFKAVAPHRCQPFDKDRKGMMVAEGAGVLVLEPLEQALARKAPVYAEVLGYGLSCDAHHMTASAVEGVAECMRKALQAAKIAPDDVDYISAHGTGTPTNDKHECAAIRAVFGERGRTLPVSSIKSMLGHAMGAASALEAIACALAVRYDQLPPTINYETPDPDCDIDCVPNRARENRVDIALNNSYAFGGNNASVVMKKICSEGGA
jgi:3-oxoacyl-[acyl-carrier-protein] synthase II